MASQTLSQIIELILAQAKAKGFGIKPKDINVAEKMVLIHSEISEAYEAYRHKNIDGPGGFNEEVADIIIRTLHLAGIMKIDIEKEILNKIKTNNNRNWPWNEMNEKHS